jgi:hypothetical protein
MSTTAFSAASFLISIARSAVLKIDDALIVSVLDVALGGVLFMSLGFFLLWFGQLTWARGRSRSFLAAGAFVTAVAVWNLFGYEELAQPGRDETLRQELNPRALALPLSMCTSYARDADFLITWEDDGVWMGRAGDTPDVVEGGDVADRTRDLVETLRREKELMRRSFRPPVAAMSVERCTPMGEVDARARRLLSGGVQWFTFSTFARRDIETRRLPAMRTPREGLAVGQPWRQDEVALVLTRTHLSVWRDSTRQAHLDRGGVVGTSRHDPIWQPLDACGVLKWAPWDAHGELSAVLRDVSQDAPPVYSLYVADDVPLQHVVLLNDVMMGAYPEYPEWRGECVRGEVILPDGIMWVVPAETL